MTPDIAAEDAPHHLKHRIGGLATVRGAAFADLDVHLIIEHSLRHARSSSGAPRSGRPT